MASSSSPEALTASHSDLITLPTFTPFKCDVTLLDSDEVHIEQSSSHLDEHDAETPRRSLRPRSSTQQLPQKRKASTVAQSSNNKALAITGPRKDAGNFMDYSIKGLALNSTMSLRRRAFLNVYRKHFIPLLANENYLTKLLKQQRASDNLRDLLSTTVPYKELQEQPEGISATLLPYQLKGLSFLIWLNENAMSGILADEMGLGKTLQTLSLFATLQKSSSSSDMLPHLVMCPLSVLQNWVNEVQRFTPSFKAFRFHGTLDQRNRQKEAFKKGAFDLIVCTYESFLSEQRWFKNQKWGYVVLDEAHLIKNPEGLTSRSLRGLRSTNRLMLTGTPLQNNLKELWSLLNWLFPEVFTEKTQDSFSEAFNISREQGVDTDFLDQTRHLLELVILRRTKESADLDLRLPPKHEIYLMVPLTSLQREVYLSNITNADLPSFDNPVNTILPTTNLAKTIASSSANRKFTHKRLFNLIIQLRRICCHPYLMPGVEPDPYEFGDHVIHSSGKFIVLQKLVEELVVHQRRKLLIFSNWTGLLDHVEELLHLLGGEGSKFRYLRLDGSTKRAGRTVRMKLFQDDNSDYRVILVSTRAGGLGINLTAASDVVFLDEDWNPQITLQAEARSHRIGQTKEVNVYKLCTRGTIEEQMLGRIHKKLYLAAKVTDNIQNIQSEGYDVDRREDDGENNTLQRLDEHQLRRLLHKSSKGLEFPIVETTELAGWTFQTMIDRLKDTSLTEAPTATEGIGEGPVNETEWVATKEKVECALFEGAKHERPAQPPIIDDSVSLCRADRRKGKETCVLINGYPVRKMFLDCTRGHAVTVIPEPKAVPQTLAQKQEPLQHQNHCLVCGVDGNLIPCFECPRSFHDGCHHTPTESFNKILAKCTQHRCTDCKASAADAGGMLLRCYDCPRAYCIDCVDWDRTKILHDTHRDFQALNYGARANTWYINCPSCNTAGNIANQNDSMDG